MKTLDAKTETEVVAYIARGDDYNKILETLKERGITTTKGTISNIKKRNPEALKFMQDALIETTLSHATVILKKSRRLLEHKLDRAANFDEDLLKLRKRYENGELEFKEYIKLLDVLLRGQLTASELNSITKESFSQSQVEQGKPSSITDNPTQARKNLQMVLNAIAAGDEKAAIEAIFLDA